MNTMTYKYCLAALLILVSGLMAVAQESSHDCIHPKTISIPLSDEIKGQTEEEIYYQPEDQYTYWYKINVVESGKFNYQLTSLNENDEYDVLIYNHTGSNFCNDVVQKKVKPVSNKVKAELQVMKGEVYYIGVLHLKGNGCGHSLTLNTGNKSFAIKAIQNECVEEIMELIVEKENKQDSVITIENKKDTIESVPPVLENYSEIKGVVLNGNTQQNVDAVISIFNNKDSEKQVISTVDSGFTISRLDTGKIITIKKLGYKPFKDVVKDVASLYKIELTPIKVGDKLVMNKIYFHPNTYVLKEESKKELAQLAKFMTENNSYHFEIQGHTNGNRMVKKIDRYAHLGEEWNFKGTSKKLSKLRAEKIKNYLVKNGMKESQLQTKGYGGDKMIVEKPKNMKQAMKNIRVEVVVIQ